MIPPFLITAWASKLGRPLMIGGALLLLIVLIFTLGRCSKDDYEDDYKAQIEQTDRSSNAVVDAASNAINTLEGRTATEDAIDQVVQETVEQIDDAPDADAVRKAVIAGLCKKPSHRNDPACQTGEE